MCIITKYYCKSGLLGKHILSICCGISSPNVEGNPQVSLNPAKGNKQIVFIVAWQLPDSFMESYY